MFIGLFWGGVEGFCFMGMGMDWINAIEFVILPLAAVYGVACVLYAVAPFFLRLIEAARR